MQDELALYNPDAVNCEAICCPYERIRFNADGTEVVHNNIGTIYFHQKFLGVGISAHELTHAALHYYKIVLKLPVSALDDSDETSSGFVGEAQEEFCTLVQLLVREFWVKYNKSFPD